jgi:VanZ family protein
VRATWSALRAIGDHLPDSPAFLDPVFDDKVLHLLMFFWPSFWAGLALGRRIRTTLGNRVLAGFLTWALVDEWLQLATGRGCEAADALANVVGVFAGVVAALSVVALVARIRPVSPEVGTRPPKSARGVP